MTNIFLVGFNGGSGEVLLLPLALLGEKMAVLMSPRMGGDAVMVTGGCWRFLWRGAGRMPGRVRDPILGKERNHSGTVWGKKRCVAALLPRFVVLAVRPPSSPSLCGRAGAAGSIDRLRRERLSATRAINIPIDLLYSQASPSILFTAASYFLAMISLKLKRAVGAKADTFRPLAPPLRVSERTPTIRRQTRCRVRNEGVPVGKASGAERRLCTLSRPMTPSGRHLSPQAGWKSNEQG